MTTSTTQWIRERQATVGLCVMDAVLVLLSGLIHLHLWRGPYRHLTVGHMNTLFLLQVIGCLVVAIAIVATRHLLAVLAGLALMIGTFVGYLIARYRGAGLFGFKLPYTTHDANLALTVEIAASVLLLITALVMLRSAPRARA
jgi:hypothetical protein